MIFLLVLPSFATEAQILPDDNYIRAVSFYEQDEPDSAMELFRKNLQSERSENKSYLYMGIIMLEENKTSEAIKFLEQTDSKYTGISSYYLAKAYARDGNLTSCLSYLDRHLKSQDKAAESEIFLDKDFAKFEKNKTWIEFWNQGNYYSNFDRLLADADYMIKNDDYLEALGTVTSGLEKGFKKSVLYEKRADIYILMKNERLAVDDIDNAIKSDKRNPVLYEKRADLEFKFGKFSQALEDYNIAIKLDPLDFELYLKRASASQKTGNFDAALADIEFYEKYFSDNNESRYRIAVIYMNEGYYLDALRYLNKTIEKDNTKAEYFLARGESYFYTRTYKNADRDLGMSLDLDPNNMETWYLKGMANIKMGNHDHACYCLSEAFRLGKKEAYDELNRSCPEVFR